MLVTLETLEEISKREADVKKQLEALVTLKKTQKNLNSQLRKIRRDKNMLIAKMYFSRKARQIELANAALCSQGSVSKIISGAHHV